MPSSFVDSISDLRSAGVPVSVNMTLTPFLPYVDSTWVELFPAYLGRAYTEALWSAWLNSTMSTAQTAVRPYVLRPLCLIAFAQYLPFAEVKIADDGITTSASSDRKPASERQIIALRRTLLESGWRHLENLLAYLDFHRADHPLYAAYADQQEPTLLASAAEFSKYHQIFGSRLTYQALRPTMDTLQADTLVPTLGDRWPELLDATDAADKALLRQLRVWLAKRTIAEAIPSLAIQLTGQGLTVHYTSDIDNIEYVNPPTEAQLQRLIDKVSEQAEAAWQVALELLNPTQESQSGRGLMDNDDRKIVFF